MLTQKSLTLINQKDDAVQRFQLNTAAVINPVLQTSILDGNLVQDLIIPSSGKLTIPHGLGRAALGVMVVMASAPVSVPYALSSDQKAPLGALVVTFTSGAGATIDVWVF